MVLALGAVGSVIINWGGSREGKKPAVSERVEKNLSLDSSRSSFGD